MMRLGVPHYARPFDPPAAYARAREIGERLGRGEIEWEDARRDCYIIARSFAQLRNLDELPAILRRSDNLATRLCWTTHETAQGLAMQRDKAAGAIRKAVRGLMADASTASVEQAAGAANDAHGSVLDWEADIFPLLKDEVAKFNARRRKR